MVKSNVSDSQNNKILLSLLKIVWQNILFGSGKWSSSAICYLSMVLVMQERQAKRAKLKESNADAYISQDGQTNGHITSSTQVITSN